ncbi:MAG: hypothetical protein ACR2PO_10410 [Methyloligellaceae bacterium]
MATTHSLGLYDRGFGHWLESQNTAVRRLTGHVSEYWQRRTDCEMRASVSRIDERALLRAEIDPKVVVWLRHRSRAA